MRLRRETGDFQIAIRPANGTNAIRTGLSAEDFAGELIDINGALEPVLSVSENEGVVTAKTASYTVTYTKVTGAITSEEGGAGGGSSSESTPLVIECRYDYPSQYAENRCVVFGSLENPSGITTVESGLTVDQWMNAVFVVTQNGHYYDSDAQKAVYADVVCTLKTACVQTDWVNPADMYGPYNEGVYRILIGEPSMTGITDSKQISISTQFDNFELYYNPTTGELAKDPFYSD